MTEREKLQSLLERVKAAGGPDRALDAIIQNHIIGWHQTRSTDTPWIATDPDLPVYTASIDAALALVEKVLPGWWMHMLRENRTRLRYARDKQDSTGYFYCELLREGGDFAQSHIARTAPLAILAALLTALAASKENADG